MAFTRYKQDGLNYVLFGTMHSYNTFGMLVSRIDIEPPKRRITLLETNISDGFKDITDTIATEYYKSRKLKITFAIPEVEKFNDTYALVMTNINGKYFDGNIYIRSLNLRFTGRAQVDSISKGTTAGTCTITIFAQPWSITLHQSADIDFADATESPNSTSFVIKPVKIPSSISTKIAADRDVFIIPSRTMYISSDLFSISRRSITEGQLYKIGALTRSITSSTEIAKIEVLKGYQSSSTYKLAISEKVRM